MRKLILFDIDGTLVSMGGAGTRSMNLAFNEIFGIPDAFKDIPMAGKTDIQIMKEGLKLHKLSYMDGNVEKMMNGYIRFLEKEVDNPFKHLKPGIKETLDLLIDMEMTLGLLTGNLEKGANIKLGAFNLNEYFLEDRDNLLPVALDKFAKKGFTFTPDTCVVVGDTPRDVRCAKIHGAACIAVATGPYSKNDLLGTGADIVVDSLVDTAKYMSFIKDQ
jgi:phosphoglycolate phosphatase-like HAD superfamily hydrolase